MKEIWKDLKEFEDGYQISNFGFIRSKERIIDYGWKKSKRKSKILKTRAGKLGYPYTIISLNNNRKTVKIHRLVAIHFIENLENKPQVNHIDGNKQNNHYSNLEWVTSKENVAHAYKTGLSNGVKGEKSHLSKLKKEDVLNICVEYKQLNSQKKLAEKYNVSQSQISRIINNKNWKENHIPVEGC
jgi:hypothetical protein